MIINKIKWIFHCCCREMTHTKNAKRETRIPCWGVDISRPRGLANALLFCCCCSHWSIWVGKQPPLLLLSLLLTYSDSHLQMQSRPKRQLLTHIHTHGIVSSSDCFHRQENKHGGRLCVLTSRYKIGISKGYQIIMLNWKAKEDISFLWFHLLTFFQKIKHCCKSVYLYL